MAWRRSQQLRNRPVFFAALGVGVVVLSALADKAPRRRAMPVMPGTVLYFEPARSIRIALEPGWERFGREYDVPLTEDTRYQRGSTTIPATDITPGLRVMVESSCRSGDRPLCVGTKVRAIPPATP